MLERLAPAEQSRLVEAMRTIERLLGPPAEHRVPYVLRLHRPGDMGWVVHRHGRAVRPRVRLRRAIRGAVATIVAKFHRARRSKRERCWIAEK